MRLGSLATLLSGSSDPTVVTGYHVYDKDGRFVRYYAAKDLPPSWSVETWVLTESLPLPLFLVSDGYANYYLYVNENGKQRIVNPRAYREDPNGPKLVRRDGKPVGWDMRSWWRRLLG